MKFGILLLVFVLGCGCHRASPTPESHGGADHHEPHAAGMAISAQARIQMGLEIARVEKSNFTIFDAVPAIVQVPPDQVRRVSSSVAGRVARVMVRQGVAVTGGQVLLELVREPLPRIRLQLTEDLLLPVSEEVHQTAVELGAARSELDIADRELERVRGLNSAHNGEALVPRQRVVEMEYNRTRAEKNVNSLRARLRLHGLADAQIETLAEGDPVVFDEQRWLSSLQANGLWGPGPQRLLEALPEALRHQAWCYAGIGELHAMGLLHDEVIDWFCTTPEAGPLFNEIAGLLQGGTTLEEVKALFAARAFSPLVAVTAPGDASDLWDVVQVSLRTGETASAGGELVVLQNQTSLQLVAFPAGKELALLRSAVGHKTTLEATPLVKGSGPDLKGLQISQLLNTSSDSAPVAIVPFSNTELQVTHRDEQAYRTWSVLPETRYQLRVPVRELSNVWVLPVTAIVEQGGGVLVFVENGDSFESRDVAVLYRDDASVALDPVSSLFPGDRVVTKGAFSLLLALQSSAGGGVDPHAGHNH